MSPFTNTQIPRGSVPSLPTSIKPSITALNTIPSAKDKLGLTARTLILPRFFTIHAPYVGAEIVFLLSTSKVPY